tara:strand:+ start:124 stop:432 length:309 start_codon:yes stop_codon:yes gene_type:complete
MPSKAEIEAFCGTCDRRQPNGSCILNSIPNPGREYRPETIQIANDVAALPGTHSPVAVADAIELASEVTDQQTFVTRQECTWAMVGSEMGTMTADGFAPNKS